MQAYQAYPSSASKPPGESFPTASHKAPSLPVTGRPALQEKKKVHEKKGRDTLDWEMLRLLR